MILFIVSSNYGHVTNESKSDYSYFKLILLISLLKSQLNTKYTPQQQPCIQQTSLWTTFKMNLQVPGTMFGDQ